MSIPFGGQVALGFALFKTIDVDYPFETIIENGCDMFLNWFFSLYPESRTCLYIFTIFT